MRRNADRRAWVDEAALLKVLSDPTRLRLAVLLSLNGETCVCALAAGLLEPEYKISRHLAKLRSSGVVEARRAGTWMYYRLVQPRSRFEECLWRCFRYELAAQERTSPILSRVRKFGCIERKRS